MQKINEYSFSGKRAIVRVDFNVPIDKKTNQITDDKRIRAAIPTLKYILSNGGSIVLLSHFGRPKQGYDEKFSLKIIIDSLEQHLGKPVKFVQNCVGKEAIDQCVKLKGGEILLMENVRFHNEESNGDMAFAEQLSFLGDCFVNDAFGAAHRAHSSTTKIASYFPNDRMMGFLMEAELQNAEKIIKNPQRPFTAIIGGAKVSDKVLIVENLLNIASDIIIGGGMAYTFSKAMGGDIGDSLFEEDRIQKVIEIINQAKIKGVNIHLPIDSMVANAFSENATCKQMDSGTIPKGWMGLDIGPKAIESFREVIFNSRTILWNGPMGVFEWNSFENGTKEIAIAVAKATNNGSFSLIGGGDSAAALAKFNLEKDVSYVSTGGGALLEFFEGKTLPGIAALS